jgi:DNA ligase-1
MIIHNIYLVTRNARDKVQVVLAQLDQNMNTFTIKRTTGQYQGKMTAQPNLVIDKGKAKRSVIQQAELEFTSIVKKYLDKGYKRLDSLTSKEFDELTTLEMDAIVPTLKSDSSGALKPMLAKSSNDCQNSVLNKPMRCSRKLNGVRCMIKYDLETDTIITISRGGKNYNASTEHLHENLKEIFKVYPDITLDGELYRYGRYLQEISGIARLQKWEERCSLLEYWIYDIADGEKIFDRRLEILEDLKELVDDKFDNIKVLEHIKTQSWEEIQRLHNKWVNEGFEGLVARKPDKVYAFGKRGSDMIKVKEYQEDEFEIIDYSEKLRDEDFCFILQTKDGGVFEAKPIGTREMKAEYIANIDDIIGRMGTVKYFEISKDGLPLQTTFQCVRYDLD